jgi:hypothetical protein
MAMETKTAAATGTATKDYTGHTKQHSRTDSINTNVLKCKQECLLTDTATKATGTGCGETFHWHW